MLAGYGVLVMIALMSRAPALERGVGADVLARWHGVGGRIVVTLVLVHAWAAVLTWSQSRGEGPLLSSWQVLHLPDLMTATLGTLLLLTVAAVSARSARRRLSYETWHGLHLLTYVAIGLSFAHQLAGPDFTGHLWLQIVWSLLYAEVFGLLLAHRVIAPLRQGVRHRLRVDAVLPLAPGVVSIVVAGEHLEELHAEPGQFFRWRFLTSPTWRSAHPFSLSAAPTGHHLRITVKALGGGSTLLQHIPVGTRVLAEGPYGAMTAAARTRRHVLLIAGGVGITPLRTLLETLPVLPGQDLTLLYRARSTAELLFRDELDAIAHHRSVRVRYLLGADRSSLTAPGLQRLVPDIAERDVYLCGPPNLADTVRRTLAELNVPDRQVHEERFAF
ncbi:ferredoxin reductase family protein [Kineococcus rubinsiae]|uniref:ferredoxin reductase family protein n=1 Tax=Kineococcus rubinsiae TaxID=2609562 RepID=UPI001AD948C4|nr:ferric reductase-like transmembrane domain-containing protein [Kineococcus rubinsiae]NIZ92275.1 ferric reductase [Kineococcus rubinsiae]